MSAKIFKKTVNKVVNENVRSGVLKRRINLGAGSGSGAEATYNVSITMVDQSTVSFFVEATLSRDALTEQNIQGSQISSVVIGNSVAHIAPATFYRCYALQNIEFQENSTLQTIGMRAFESTQLTSFSVVSSVKSIGEFAFSNISTLARIDVEDENSVYSSKHGRLYSKDGSVLLKYPEGDLQDIIDMSEEDVIEVAVGALERLSFVSSLYLPRKLEVIRGRGVADYSYANTKQKLTTLNIPKTVKFIEPGAFDNMQLSALVVPPGSLAYSSKSFINCSVKNIFFLFPPSIWVKCIIGTNNTIEIKQPVEAATMEDIVSTGITIVELENYGYINVESIATAINVNTQLSGKYVNSYWVEAGEANNSHYTTLRSNYADSSLGQVPTLDLVISDEGNSSVVGTLSYRSKERYAVQSPIYTSWTTSNISNVDDAITITYVGDKILMKVEQFPAVQLSDGIYYMQRSMWRVDNTMLKNISSNESYTYNATTENYESLSNDRTLRALVGSTSKKTYYMEDENSSLFLYYNTSFLQSVKSAGIYNDTPDVDVVVRAANFQGFRIDLAQNATMPQNAPGGGGLAYMNVYNDFSNVAIVSLTNLIKYTLTFEVSAFNGLVDSCYAYIRTYNANKSENTIQKLPITDVGTYTATFLTQKSLIDNFSLEEIGIECFANTSAAVHLTVSTCLLDVQIYEDNPADYYTGNGLLLSDGTYNYINDTTNLPISFKCYRQDDTYYLQFLSNETYVFNEEYGVYIKVDDERLYYVFNDTIMTGELNQQFTYTKLSDTHSIQLEDGQYKYGDTLFCLTHNNLSTLIFADLSIYAYDTTTGHYINVENNQQHININKDGEQYSMIYNNISYDLSLVSADNLPTNLVRSFFQPLSKVMIVTKAKVFVPKQAISIDKFLAINAIVNKTYLFPDDTIVNTFKTDEKIALAKFSYIMTTPSNTTLDAYINAYTASYDGYERGRFMQSQSSTSITYRTIANDGTVQLLTDTTTFVGYYVLYIDE